MAVFKKMFIAYNVLPSRDIKKVKTPLYFSRQDASKYVSGDFEKSRLKSELFTLTHYVQILRPYQKKHRIEIQKVFSHLLRNVE